MKHFEKHCFHCFELQIFEVQNNGINAFQNTSFPDKALGYSCLFIKIDAK